MTVIQSDDHEQNVLSYSSCPGGITNQKLALLGLFQRAIEIECRRVALPRLLNFNVITRQHEPIEVGDVFEIDQIHAFACRHGIEVLDCPPVHDWGRFDYVVYARNKIAHTALRSELVPDGFVCEFFRSLKPKIDGSPLLRRMRELIFEQAGVEFVLQLRLEFDWTNYIRWHVMPVSSKDEDFLPPAATIFSKIRNSFGPLSGLVYVASDEKALAEPKEAIKAAARDILGVKLVWKSDLLSSDELAGLSILESSLLDFDLAVRATTFVGPSRSSFACGVTLEKYALTGRPAPRHYIYNAVGDRLASRDDFGAFDVPQLAASAYYNSACHGLQRGTILQATGSLHEAVAAYESRVALLGGSTDERYIALYRIAQILSETGSEPDQIIEAYERAIELIPTRAEAFHGASRYCRCSGRFQDGFTIAGRALGLRAPENGLCVEDWIYEYGLLDEYAVNAYWIGAYASCLQACTTLLADRRIPDDFRGRIRMNAEFALARI